MKMPNDVRVWSDRRSGPVGCMAGNAVLATIQKREDEEVRHEKGTIFSTSQKMIVGRMCSSDKYLQNGILHFCNMSMQQHNAAMNSNKKVVYLFITVGKTEIHFWEVPGKKVGDILPSLSTKPDGTTRFLRIVEKDDRHFLANLDITSYHEVLPLKPAEVEKLRKEQESVKDSSYKVREDGNLEVKMSVKGQEFIGVLQPQ